MTKAEQKLLNAFLHLQQAFKGCCTEQAVEADCDGHWSAFHFDAKGDGKEVFNIFGGNPCIDISFRKYEDGWRI